MSNLDTGPKASSTAIKSQSQRSLITHLKDTKINDTFSSMFSDELSGDDLVKQTFSEVSSNKTNVRTDSMFSSFSGQSSLGILELDNMSDIGNAYKRETFHSYSHNRQPLLQHRLSQVSQVENTLARASRASSIINIVNKNEVNDKSFGITSSKKTNIFPDWLKDGINQSNSSFSSDDFIPANEFKENLIQIEEAHRKEFGSLSESRFNFTLEGEKQSIENESYTAKYFAAKSVPIEDLSAIFPRRQNNITFTKGSEKNCIFDNDTKNNQENSTPYKTMSSITSWTDSNVSNNLLNLTSLSDISEVLTSETYSANPKEITKALLSGALSSLENYSFAYPQRISNTNKKVLKLNESSNFNKNDENKTHGKIINTLTQSTISDQINLSGNFDRKHNKLRINNGFHFNLTPKSGYFEECTSETKILENNIDLSNFSVLTNNCDVFTEMTLNKSANVSKVIHCNEILCKDKLNQSLSKNYRAISEVLEIGETCIGTYSQVVITLENQLKNKAKYTLNLLKISKNDGENNTSDENKSAEANIATVLCSDKICTIPTMSEASFTIGIIPLTTGLINIYVKLGSKDISQEIYRNIQVHAVEPQIIWLNNSFGSIDFGLLPELSKKSMTIKMLNKGTYQVPIKFILNQDQCEDVFQVKAIINPSELWECDLNMLTSSFSKNNPKIKRMTGRLQVVLDSVEELSFNYSPLLYSSNLSGCVGRTSISFDKNPLILQINGQSTLNGVVEITNNSELPINLFVQKNSKEHSEFSFHPDKFQLAMNEKVKMKIIYTSINPVNYISETNLCLQVESSQKQFFVKVNCAEPDCEFRQIKSPSSRPISPWSTSSSSAVGQLELESTCSSLIWGSVPLNTQSVQTFTLRNRGSHKEKLLLNIKDNTNCFKLIFSGENHVSEMKLLLAPMESQKLSVALISTSNEGQAYGHIILQRQHSNEKRVISLYGYCGHSAIKINGILEDTFGNMWLYPNPQLMTAQLSVTNSGNAAAFVKVCQEKSSEDIIEPNEFLLKKGETTTIDVTIIMSPERLEMLIEQDSSSKIININKISLIYGDEVSRVRVSRLWKKIRNEKKIVYPDRQRLNDVSKMFCGKHFVNVDHLADSEKSLCKLWNTGINEVNIVVLMEKGDLESLLCDTTTVFNELETTVINRLPDM